jgi:TRAP-type mannitol/chloroaromatic compound transport system substrate-binding protein
MGDGMKYANQLWEPYGYIMGYMAYGPEVWMSNKPLTTVADIRGLKFRAYGPCCDVFGALGASVVTIAGGELYQAVEKGIVDAYEIGGPDWNRTMGFHEVSTHVGTPGIHSPIGGGTHTLVNHDSWAKLPDDLKALWTEAWKASALNDYLDSLKMDALALEAWRDVDGMILYEVGDELQREFARIAREQALAHAAGDPLYKEIFENQAAFVETFNTAYRTHPKYSVFYE